MSTTESTPTLVRVNRVKDGWTFSVSATKDTSPEQLREAKDTALQIAYELRDELLPTLNENSDKDPDEVPF
jgi:hypothetical protein